MRANERMVFRGFLGGRGQRSTQPERDELCASGSGAHQKVTVPWTEGGRLATVAGGGEGELLGRIGSHLP